MYSLAIRGKIKVTKISTWMYSFKKSNKLSKIRNQYLDSLYEPQELFLELMISQAEKYLIKKDDFDIGYFIYDEGYLLEFFLIDNYLPECWNVFKKVMTNYKLEGAYCKSFDSVLLKVCVHTHKLVNIIGVLYRNFMDKEILQPGEIDEIRIANISDFKGVAQIKDEVFDTDEEVEYTIKKEAVFIFKNQGSLIGFGIFHPAIEGRKSYDIGMAVSPDYRRKGYGAFILNYLKNHCITNNWQPTCGCAIENIASQKTIEKIGFVSKHNMLKFTF